MLPNVVLFEGEDTTDTASLWETNGTASGTFELLTNPPAVSGQAPITGEAVFGFAPSTGVSIDLTVFNNQVLFAGRYSPTTPIDIGPYTLWTTDGTVAWHCSTSSNFHHRRKFKRALHCDRDARLYSFWQRGAVSRHR